MKPYYQTELGVLYHGDCLEIMPEIEPVDLIATSPPYNCRIKYEDFFDEKPWPQYYAEMELMISWFYKTLITGGILAINVPSVIRYQHDHKYRETWSDFDPLYLGHRNGAVVRGRGRIEPISHKILSIMFSKDPHLREPVVWVKGKREGNEMATTYQMGSDNNPYMRPCHELILLGSKKQWHHRGGTGRRGREAVPFLDITKDVWYIPPTSDKNHPAVWPEEIPKRLTSLFLHAPGSVVYDPFCGKGTTPFFCERNNIKWIASDISEKYCEIAAKRIEQEYKQRKLF